MREPSPPLSTEDTPIGSDVDLEREDVWLANGTRLTQEVVDAIVAEATLRGS